MQRILIVSDTHKRLGNLYEALEKEGSVDAMIHLGDLEGDDIIIMYRWICRPSVRKELQGGWIL